MPTKLIDVLISAQEQLQSVDIQSAKLDAEVLLAFTLGCERVDLYLDRNRELSDDERKRYDSFIERRTTCEPVAYITGTKEFWSLPLKVTRDVLVPRPETELLVERTLEIAHSYTRTLVRSDTSQKLSPANERTSAPVYILDLGTGSGCIAAALAKELPEAHLTVSDVSAAAIEVARENLVSADGRVEFVVSDLFSAFDRETGRPSARIYDLITTNPPYVPEGHRKYLARDNAGLEPDISIFAGKSGLDFVARIIEDAATYLRPGGWLVMEMGLGQGEKLTQIADLIGAWEKPVFTNDLAGIERIISLKRKT